MPTTYTPLATTTAAGGETSITFSSISQAYTDLILVVSASQSTSSPVYVRVNGLTTSIYSNTWMAGNGSTATSNRYSAASLGGAGFNLDNINGAPFPTDFSGQATYHFMNYANTTTNKTILLRHGTAAGFTTADVGLIQTTNAISSITIYPFSGSWNAGSTFSLYGVASAAVVSGMKATGGDVVATDGTYWYHAFRSSGTFTPSQALTCDVVVIAGGGGGGAQVGGGGGAGGIFYATSQSLSTAQTVTIGGGGTGGIFTGAKGTNGGNSSFGSLTAGVGGGGGGSLTTGQADGSNGGSGGAPSYSGGGPTQGTAGTSTQTGTGGTGYGNSSGTGTYPSAGGGGGAGQVGQNSPDSNNGGLGGNGLNTWSSWGSVTGTGQNISGTYWFAGGGGGASQGANARAGGSGGGGTGGGSTTIAPTAGTVNTGGGGGGSRDLPASGESGGRGGSGIVIVRYAV